MSQRVGAGAGVRRRVARGVAPTLGLVVSLVISVTVALSGAPSASAAGPAPGGGPPHGTPPHGTPPDAGVLADFERLRAFVAPLPDEMLGHGPRTALLRTLASAAAAYRRGQPCTAANVLGAAYRQTQARRRAGDAIAEELGNLVRGLRSRLLAHVPATARCAETAGVGAAPAVALRTSDDQELSGAVTFGEAALWTVLADGRAFTQLQVPGIEYRVGAPGLPAVPVWRKLIAAPRGARVEARLVAAPQMGERLPVLLIPFQEQAVDQASPGEEPPPESDFADPPFTLDRAAYATDAPFPGYDVRVTPVGLVRDLELYQLEVPVGQYNPAREELTLHRTVEWQVTFRGGAGFVTERSLNPFEHFPGGVDRAVLNADAIYRHVDPLDIGFHPCSGEELLILSHPALLDAALRLRDHKRSRGISTNVLELPSRVRFDDVDALIEDRWHHCAVRPSYVLLFGDVDTIPTRYDTAAQDNEDGTPGCAHPRAGDYLYGLVGAFFKFMPDMGVARIPVKTLAEADVVVDKIVAYENDPPELDSFYRKASFAGQFECCRYTEEPEYPFAPPGPKAALLDAWHALYDGTSNRSYVASLEYCRDELLSQGYEVDRIYLSKTISEYDYDPTPRRYYDGSPLPADLGPGGTFYWLPTYQHDLATQDIVDAWNDGRFLVVHRDHGWIGGWGTPSFDQNDVNGLSNGALQPFVFSVNCASGAFDNETAGGECYLSPFSEYFPERLLKSPDGAVAYLGDSRNSPTWENSALLLGFVDAIWPDTVPDFGGPAPRRRLADILNHGKVYLMELLSANEAAPIPGKSLDGSDIVHQLVIWHALGDPTLRIWTANPHTILLDTDFDVAPGTGLLQVHYAVEGAEITATQEDPETGEVHHVGRGTVQNGTATLAFVEPPLPGVPIRYTAASEGAITVELGRVAR